MPQSLANLPLHLVFSTKDRRPFLIDPGIRSRTHEYLGGVTRTLGCPPIEIGGVSDHVHILAQLSRTLAVADWVKEVKRVTALWLKEQGSADFQWQAGYGVFAVSQSNVVAVRDYVRTQEAHHQKRTFQDEFRTLLRRHGIEFDERYTWD
jgi:REP element-mobilizing transposase RayT